MSMTTMSLPLLAEASIKKSTRVIIRADFNTPVRKGVVVDDFKIRAALSSIRFVLKKGGYARIISHRGRPHGKKMPSLSLQPVASHLKRTLKHEIIFIRDPLDEKNLKRFAADKRILFFENIRFWPGEETNDRRFVRALARWGDIFVNEAFAVSHRHHASIVGLARILPSYAGLFFEKEVTMLQKVIHEIEKPVVVILGGAKARTKFPFLIASLERGYDVLVGGVLANTILWKKSVDVGKSRVDQGLNGILEGAMHLQFPKDVVVAAGITKKPRITNIRKIGKKESIYDIGPETVQYFSSILQRAKTIIWNGPLGVTEVPKFSRGTIAVARVIQKLNALKVVGGGDSVAVFKKNHLLNAFTHVSTGGGAMLAFLAGEKLPGIEALKK